ncbi:MAG TPA: hypothetical protein VHW70_02395, partial [Edaphobacter sp.]|nr:hypothetical protein [Edaphobacter sp.]
MDRRNFLRSSLVALAGESISRPAMQALLVQPTAAVRLEPWKPGILEIHHLATNRGNSAFLILPDGTTMMVDAGALYGATPYLSEPKPSAARRPGEWIGRYVQRRLQPASLSGIDFFMLTHLHADHLGALPPNATPTGEGYVCTGVSDVASIVPIRQFVDRAWPDYTYPLPATADFQRNYRTFLHARKKSGAKVERFRVGVQDQFKLLHNAGAYPDFEVRNLVANGEVWTGQGESTTKHFPDLTSLKPEDYPSEN